jgi:hypothetical protein
MTMTRVGRSAIGLALAAMLGCSETETRPATPPAPAPAAAPAGANAPTPPPAPIAVPGPSPEAPQLDAQEAEEARRAIEASLEDVRRQLQEKAAELGTQAEPAPAQP